jgi:HPt (histidine-containing phosphotransfer) domain-containing protein
MKSALTSIGEKELSSLACDLEEAARSGKTAEIVSRMPDFLGKLRRIAEKVRPAEDAEAPAAMREEDTRYLKDKLEELHEACIQYDKRAAKDLLAELKKKKWPPAERKLLSAITEQLLHSEFDKASEQIHEFKDAHYGK